MSDRLNAPQCAELISRLYKQCNHEAGGCMHVQLDDGNLRDVFFNDESLESIMKCGCTMGLVVFTEMKKMRRTAREKACYLSKRLNANAMSRVKR